MSLRAQMLGSLNPEADRMLRSRLQAVEDLYQQGVDDIIILADIGMDPSEIDALKAELDLIGERILALRAGFLTLVDDDTVLWEQDVDRVHQELLAFLARTGPMRQGTLSSQQFYGLGWGLGVAAVTAAVATVVWVNRRRRRRRT